MTFEYDYEKYDTKIVDEKVIDDLIQMVLSAGTGYWASIIAGIKLLCIAAFIFIKWRMLEKDLMIAKQKYQIKQSKNNKDQINQDDLD